MRDEGRGEKPHEHTVEREYGEDPAGRAGDERAVAQQPAAIEARRDPGGSGHLDANQDGQDEGQRVP